MTTKKLGQYANDMWIALKHRKECYLALFNKLDRFAAFSGLRVNYNKTEILRIGSLRDSNASYYVDKPLHWSDGPIRILGIQVTSNVLEMTKLNYQGLIEKIQNICCIWSKRSLTLLGRILIVNTLLIPTLVYRLQVLPSPSKDILLKFKKIIQNFLWEGKRPKIAYSRLIRSYENGGLNLQDIELKDTAMKVKWAQLDRLQGNLMSELFKDMIPLKDQKWECNLTVKDVEKNFDNSIMTDILKAWARINAHTPTGVTQVTQQVLWYNSLIKSNGKLLFYKKWAKLSIVKFEQLLSDTRLKTCQELIEQYGKGINIIDYHRLIKAIPKEWIMILQKRIQTKVSQTTAELVQDTKNVRKLYIKRLGIELSLKKVT